MECRGERVGWEAAGGAGNHLKSPHWEVLSLAAVWKTG